MNHPSAMALILNIDTATETAGVCVAADGKLLSSASSVDQKDHAAWLHPAIERCMEEAGLALRNLQAVAVTDGPGSYTGLRVGMAAAKGFCYALSVPMITEHTLKLMAYAIREDAVDLICPMIDARRMEVFAAVYTKDLQELLPPSAIILNKNSFEDILKKSSVLFTGSGIGKWKELVSSPNYSFTTTPLLANHLAEIAEIKFRDASFTDIIYSEPAYIKEFHTHTKK